MNIHSRWTIIFALVIIFGGILMAGCDPELDTIFTHQGRLLDSEGKPVQDGNYTFEYKLYRASASTPSYTEVQEVAVKNGLFNARIGASKIITPELFSQPMYLEVTVEGEKLSPKQQLMGAPYAFSLVPNAVIRGDVPITRTYLTYNNTGAVLSVINTADDAKGGNGLLVVSRAAATGAGRDVVAGIQVIAPGGSGDTSGATAGIFKSEHYAGINVQSHSSFYSGVFNNGIVLTGGSCSGCTTVYMAKNLSGQTIQPGDFIAASDVTVDPELGMPVMVVRKATSADDVIVGVSTGLVTREEVGEIDGIRTGGFQPTGGNAEWGDYLGVAVQGLVQANVGLNASLKAGDRLTMSADGSLAAAGDGATVIGRIMSQVDENGVAWVLLSSQ